MFVLGLKYKLELKYQGVGGSFFRPMVSELSVKGCARCVLLVLDRSRLSSTANCLKLIGSIYSVLDVLDKYVII